MTAPFASRCGQNGESRPAHTADERFDAIGDEPIARRADWRQQEIERGDSGGAARLTERLRADHCTERRIALPAGRFEAAAPELAQGCLLVRLRRIA